jgi:hypothetical protein
MWRCRDASSIGIARARRRQDPRRRFSEIVRFGRRCQRFGGTDQCDSGASSAFFLTAGSTGRVCVRGGLCQQCRRPKSLRFRPYIAHRRKAGAAAGTFNRLKQSEDDRRTGQRLCKPRFQENTRRVDLYQLDGSLMLNQPLHCVATDQNRERRKRPSDEFYGATVNYDELRADRPEMVIVYAVVAALGVCVGFLIGLAL